MRPERDLRSPKVRLRQTIRESAHSPSGGYGRDYGSRNRRSPESPIRVLFLSLTIRIGKKALGVFSRLPSTDKDFATSDVSTADGKRDVRLLKKWDRHPTCCGLANRITQHIGSQSHFFNSLPRPGGVRIGTESRRNPGLRTAPSRPRVLADDLVRSAQEKSPAQSCPNWAGEICRFRQ
jgi:hypothetical protein